MPGGRPLKFESPQKLQILIDKYFSETPEIEWTITGLALALDTTRLTLIQYSKRDEFINTIKRAKTKVEYSYEKSLRKNGRAGDIFGLKNFGWVDKTEVKATGEIKHNHTISEDDLMERLDQLKNSRISSVN